MTIRRVPLAVGALIVMTSSVSCLFEPRPSDERAVDVRQAIRNGSPLDGRPEVVALMKKAEVRCSGTIVSDRLVLTAAHCFDAARAESDGCGVAAEEPVFAFVGARPPTDPWPPNVCPECPFRHVTAALVHPRYRFPGDPFDVAIAVLDPAAPVSVRPATRCTSVGASTIGSDASLIGFGLQSIDDATPQEKRQGTARVRQLDERMVTLEPAPANACVHDSGGAVFTLCDSDPEPRFAAVIVAGDLKCETTTAGVRVDGIWESFVSPQIVRVRPGSAGIGERCFYEGHCAEGTCEASLDDARVSFCSVTCSGADSCPAGMSCRPRANAEPARCYWKSPSPGLIGSPCRADDECLSRVCARGSGAAAASCTVACSAFLESQCACGRTCQRDENSDGARHACLEPTPGPEEGCAFAGGRRSRHEHSFVCGGVLFFLLLQRRRGRMSFE